MTIRTISQLPEENAAMQDNTLLEICQPRRDDKYISKKVKYEFIRDSLTDTLSNIIGDEFNMYASKDPKVPINVKDLSAHVISVYYDDIQLSGVKTFKDIPEITVNQNIYKTRDDNAIPNITKVKDLINKRACFIDQTYKIDSNPGADFNPSFIKDNDMFMHWHIDDKGRDSTEWMNPIAGGQKTDIDGQTCYATGYLVIYGWLADNGNVPPADAWVGLYGKINVLDEDTGEMDPDKWILLQLQPWIRGTNASQKQYVSFNLPVNAGLKLKIKTGFSVNGHIGGHQDHNTITFSQNQPNSFIGYIVRPEDR